MSGRVDRFSRVWIIGDLHGCLATFEALLLRLNFVSGRDQLIFLGDLVARGPDSLGTLKRVKQLCEAGDAQTILGNHDLHLLGCWRGASKAKPRDLTEDILRSPEVNTLMNWLRRQPLAIDLTWGLAENRTKAIGVHAGSPALWGRKETLSYAHEVEQQISTELNKLDLFLAQMYGNQPCCWNPKLVGVERLRVITNYLTRMRLTNKEGCMEFSFKTKPGLKLPKNYKPWYLWPRKHPLKVYFGHWAALEAAVKTPCARALDGGCVWGGYLVAEELKTGELVTVKKLHSASNSHD